MRKKITKAEAEMDKWIGIRQRAMTRLSDLSAVVSKVDEGVEKHFNDAINIEKEMIHTSDMMVHSARAKWEKECEVWKRKL